MSRYTETSKQRAKEVTTRLFLTFEHLRAQRMVSNKIEFAEKLSTYPNIITGLGNGTRNATLEMVINLVNEYQVNPDYILFGRGEILLTKQEFVGERVTALEDRVAALEANMKTILGKRYVTQSRS